MRRTSRGFTLIEVIMALLVFTVAMLGLVALQRASVSGASMGREHTAAVNLARYVMTWLENEAAAWPLADTTPAPASLPLLNQALDLADDEEGGDWLALSDDAADTRFDTHLEHSGTLLDMSDVDTATYCVHYRVKPLGDVDDPVAYQVWVRVTWPKWKQYAAADWTNCEARRTAGVDPAVIGAFNVIELTNVVTREYTGRWTQDS
jgi:prepilin-type N-terminal cleavage/methylation domain-containing protein